MNLKQLPSITGIKRRQVTKSVLNKIRSKNLRIQNILDIGSGINNWAYIFSNENYVYETIELKTDICSTYNGNFYSFKFQKKFDLLIGTELIEHLPDSKLFFEKAAKILNAKGVLVISFPFFFKIHGDPDDFFRFTENGVRELSKNTFITKEVIPHGNRIQIAWEVLIDGKFLYFLRILNPIIISLFRFSEKEFPLGYVMVLEKK